MALPPLAVAAVLTASSQATAPKGTVSFSDLARGHVTSPVTHPQKPPVGGAHFPVWQNCGFYREAVGNENAVHSMEHGAVWIIYRLDLGAPDRQRLRTLTRQSNLLVTSFQGLPTAVVASAWGSAAAAGLGR